MADIIPGNTPARRKSMIPKLAAAAAASLLAFVAVSQHKAWAFRLGTSLVNYATGTKPVAGETDTQLYGLRETRLAAPADPGQGGAIEAFEDQVWLVTRMGDFHRLESKAFVPVALSPPEPVLLDGFYTRPKDKSALGYQDLKMRRLSDGNVEVLVTMTRVDPAEACVRVVLYRTLVEDLGERALTAAEWRETWRSDPCIASAKGSFPLQAGGEMTYRPDGQVAVFVGDFGVDYFNRSTPGVDPQARDNDYGKVLLIDPVTGADTVLSVGHRNPGGIATGPDGALWLAENAAEGGDEINLIEAGGNYGWPVKTLTTHYGQKDWPSETGAVPDNYRAPAFAFVPSPALSSMVPVSGPEFPQWEGDLAVGTLKHGSFYRVRIEDGRVILTEPIATGVRARDISIDAQGRILIKTDRTAEVLMYSRADADEADTSPELAALMQAGCTSCHGNGGVAPGLEGVGGRRVASIDGFDYSEALTMMGGKWTEERLIAFLRDPQSMVPGSLMPAADLTEDEIRDLVDTLAGN